jgi:hypothetical protein
MTLHYFGNPANEAAVPLVIMPVWGDSTDLMEGQHLRVGLRRC